MPLAKAQSMERVLGDSMSRTSFTMSVLVIAALASLLPAARAAGTAPANALRAG